MCLYAHDNLLCGLGSPFLFFLSFIYLFFRERGREGEREGEKHQCVVAAHMAPAGDLSHNPGMCPDLGIKLVTLWFAAHAQSTEAHQPGLHFLIMTILAKSSPKNECLQSPIGPLLALFDHISNGGLFSDFIEQGWDHRVLVKRTAWSCAFPAL